MSYLSGKTIRALREKKNYTQKQLADLIGVSEKNSFQVGNRKRIARHYFTGAVGEGIASFRGRTIKRGIFGE